MTYAVDMIRLATSPTPIVCESIRQNASFMAIETTASTGPSKKPSIIKNRLEKSNFN